MNSRSLKNTLKAVKKLKNDSSKPCDVSGIPAYVIARNALSRRLERESEAQIFSLKKTVRSLEDKNSDLTKQLKRTRLERDSKEREVWKPLQIYYIHVCQSIRALSKHTFSPPIHEAKFLGRNLQTVQSSLAEARKDLKERKHLHSMFLYVPF